MRGLAAMDRKRKLSLYSSGDDVYDDDNNNFCR